MIFVPSIINHTNPQIGVSIDDSGSPAVTYKQIKNSLGNHIYNVEELYIQSTNLKQLIGQIQYNRYEATGNQTYTTIATTVDPYQSANSIFFDLKVYSNLFILNGNSNISTTILPLTTVQTTFYSKRITNSFGNNLNSFKIMEEIFRKPDFFKSYGNEEEIQNANKQVLDGIDTATTESYSAMNEDKMFYRQRNFGGQIQPDDKTPILVLSAIAIYMGVHYLISKEYV